MKKTDTKPSNMFFSIAEVARMIGVTPTTIRNWEKNSLFVARRGENDYRIYSLEDVETLKRIKHYSLHDKMGIRAIRNILNPPFSSSSMLDGTALVPEYEKTPPSRKLLGSKWKEYRVQHKKTLEEVASSVGISTSYLSKIENGQANISYEILERLATYYGKSVLHFFEPEEDERVVIAKGSGEKVHSGLPGIMMEALIARKDHVLFPMMFYVEPGCGSAETHQHNGEEFIYVIKGSFQVTLDYDHQHLMKEGDSIYFKSFDHHSWKNPGAVTAQILWVHSPVESNPVG